MDAAEALTVEDACSLFAAMPEEGCIHVSILSAAEQRALDALCGLGWLSREGARFHLTEAGSVALDAAETVAALALRDALVERVRHAS